MTRINRVMFPIFAFLLSSFTVLGQDHIYANFFESPTYLNPALTGQFQGNLRMSLIYRNQWTSLPGSFNYTTAAIDYSIPQFGGGLGLIFNRSSEGIAYLNKNNIAATYAYSVEIDNSILSFGLQAGVTGRSINRDRLIFADQIDPRSGYIPGSGSAVDQILVENKFYFDSAFGLNLVIGNFNVGSVLQHINTPNQSFTGVPAKLPVRGLGHISYRWALESTENLFDDEKIYIIPSVIYARQSLNQTITAGAQFKRGAFNAGVWYNNGGQIGPSSIGVSLIFGFGVNNSSTEKMRLGVGYTTPVSGINYSNTSGIGEVNIGYQTASREAFDKFEGLLRSYDFY